MSNEFKVGVKLHVDSTQYTAEFTKAGHTAQAFAAQVSGSASSAATGIQSITGKFDGLGQAAAALRGVPAQFTDIITSIQGGQAPLTVFLQQGGQLKDMFGGAGPAARALGGYVAGLVNPFTAAAAVVGVLALGYYKGSQEADGYRAAILMSGNAAGTTVGQLTDMARAISEVTGTQGAAAAALTQMAGSGAVARENLQQFAQTAMDLERYVGVPVKSVVGDLESLAKAPLQASLKLNEQYHYLTESVYSHIKALDEQGKKEEAGAAAQQAYIAAFEVRKNEIVANLGFIERAWNAVTSAVKGAGDAMLNVGRTDTLSMQIANVQNQISQAKGLDPNRRFSMPWDTSLAVLEQQLTNLREQERMLRRGAEAKAESARKTEALAEWDKVVAANLSKQAKEAKEIEVIREKGLAAGKDQAVIEKEIAAYKAKNADKGASGAATRELERQRSLLAELAGLSGDFYKEWESLTKQFQQGKISQEDLVRLQSVLLAKQPAMVAAAKEEQHLLEQRARAWQEIQRTQERAQQQALEALQRSAKAAEQQVQRLHEEEAAASLAASANIPLAEAVERVALARAEDNYQKALGQAADGATLLALQKEIDARREIVGLVRGKEAREGIKKTADEAEKELKRVTEQYEQGLTNAAMQGGKSLREYIQGMLRTTAFRIVLDPFMKPLAGFLAGATGSGSVAASQGGGIMGTANLLSSAYSALTTGVSSSITAGFAKLAGSSFGQSIGLSNSAAIMGNNPSAYVPAGGQLTELGQSLSTGLGMLGNGLAGYGISSAISNGYTTGGNTVNVLSGIASAFFGPLAGVVGGLINRAFGRKLKDTGIEGTIGGSAGFEGNSYQFYKGGWLRSDKTVRGDLDAGVDKSLDTAVKQMQLSMAGLATSIGAPTEAISSFSQAIKVSFNGLDEAGIQEKIKETLADYNEGLASAFIASVDRSELPKWVDRLMGNVDASAVERLQAIADYPAKLLQSFGTSRDQLAQLYAEGLASGDTAAAGRAVADSLVASIEANMLGNASAQVFDIVNQGIVTPMLDAIVLGQNVSEALSQASIQKTIERAKETAAAFAELWNNAEFTAALEDIRTTVGSALGNAGAAMDYIPRYTRALNDAADAALRAEDAERKRIAALHESARKIVETQQGALDALKRSMQEAAIVQRGGMIGSLAVTAQEAEAAQQFTTALGDATGALAELEKLGLADELSGYTAEIGKIVQETKSLLADQVASSRLLAGNARGALDALMSASTLAFDRFMDLDGREGFNAGAFNAAWAKEQALAARELGNHASANALQVQNVGAVLGQLSAHASAVQEYVRRDMAVDVAATLGTTTSSALARALDSAVDALAQHIVTRDYVSTGPGLASVAAARGAYGRASETDWIGGRMVMGSDAIAYAKSLSAIDAELTRGRITADDAARAVQWLQEKMGGLAGVMAPLSGQIAGAAHAALDLSTAGLASVRYYFDQTASMAAALGDAAAQANAPVAQVTGAIGRMQSASTAFGASAQAAVDGMSAAIAHFSDAAQQALVDARTTAAGSAEWYALYDASGNYAMQGRQANAALEQMRLEGSDVRNGFLVAQAASIAAQVMTTASAAEFAKQIASNPAFAGLDEQQRRNAALLIDGVTAHDAAAFEGAFVRLGAALDKGAITEAQYIELTNLSLRTLAGEQAELERHTSQVVSAFDRLRDAARSTADALLIDDNASTLTGAQIAAEAQRQYADVMARLRADPTDSQAASEMAAASKAMLAAVQNVSTAAEYSAIFAETIRDLRVVEATQAPSFQSTTPVLKVPAFDVGADYLPHDMLALVHQGERILPAADNRQLMQLLGGGGNGGTAEVATLLREILARLEQLERSNLDGHHANEIANNKSAEALLQMVAEGLRPYEETPA